MKKNKIQNISILTIAILIIGSIIAYNYSTDIIKISGDDVAEIGMQAQASTSSPSAGSTISVASATNATSALTKIDTAIEKKLRSLIQKKYPDHGVLDSLPLILTDNLSMHPVFPSKPAPSQIPW